LVPQVELHDPPSAYEAVLRCLALKGEVGSPIGGFAPVFPGYRPGDHLPLVIGVSGADPRNCTSHLVLTKDAVRYQNLEGK